MKTEQQVMAEMFLRLGRSVKTYHDVKRMRKVFCVDVENFDEGTSTELEITFDANGETIGIGVQW